MHWDGQHPNGCRLDHKTDLEGCFVDLFQQYLFLLSERLKVFLPLYKKLFALEGITDFTHGRIDQGLHIITKFQRQAWR